MTEPSQHNHPRRNVWWNCRRRQARACENQPLEPGPPLSDAFFSFCKSFSRLSCFFSSSCNRHGNRHGWNHAAMPFVPPQKNMKRLPKSWRGWCLDQKKSGDLANNGVVYSRHAQKCRSSSFSTRFWCLYLNLWTSMPWKTSTHDPQVPTKNWQQKCKKRTFKNYTVTKKINCGDGKPNLGFMTWNGWSRYT